MKKSELRFKCVLGSEKRNKRMYDAIIRAGIKNHIREEDFVKTAMCLRIDDTWMKEVSPTYASKITESYEDSTVPEVAFETALEMLKSIEPDAPEFDIKPLAPILWKQVPRNENHNDTVWHLDLYADRMNLSGFACVGHADVDCIMPYNSETEHFNNSFDYPAGWWECEGGVPVWRTK